MTRNDIPAAMRLKDAEGWNQTAADWECLLTASPEGCFAAESNGRVCGTATTITYEGRFSWVGMVVVDAAVRGKGIGTQLLEKAIDYLDARRVPTVKLDATPRGKPVYEKLGFVPEYEIERWSLGRKPVETEPAAPIELSALHQIKALDREAFGADRSELLASLHRDAPARGNSIRGYAFGRRGSRADHFGPCWAVDQGAGRELLGEFLRRSRRELIFVDCVQSNSVARQIVRARGFEFQRPLTRMYRGPNEYPGRPELFCAILGPEFG